MTDAADRLFVNGERHTLAAPNEAHDALDEIHEASPWDWSDAIRDIGVAMTVVDGEVVYDGR